MSHTPHLPEKNGESPLGDTTSDVVSKPEISGDSPSAADDYLDRLKEERDDVHWFLDQVMSGAWGGLEWIREDVAYDYPEQVKKDLNETARVAGWCRNAYDRFNVLCTSVAGQDPILYERLTELTANTWIIAWKDRWRHIEHMTKRTFPRDSPVVDVSRTPWEDWGGVIPSLGKWKRENRGAPDETYYQYVAEARKSAMSNMSLQQELPADTEVVSRIISQQVGDRQAWSWAVSTQSLQQELLEALKGATVQNVSVTYEGESEPVAELHYWNKKIRDGLMEIVRRIDTNVPGQDEDTVKNNFAKSCVDEQLPFAKRALEDLADERARAAVVEELEKLRQKLRSSTITPEHIGTSSVGRVAKKRSVIPRDSTPVQTETDNDTMPERISINTEIAKWLEGEDSDRSVLYVAKGENGRVLVMDFQTEAMKKIASKSSCNPKYINDKLKHMANMIATSKHGQMSGMNVVGNAHAAYNYPVMYLKNLGPNAKRVYVAQIPLRMFASEPSGVYDVLERQGVHSIVAYIGACDKAHQLEMLGELTGETRQVIRAKGGGSI